MSTESLPPGQVNGGSQRFRIANMDCASEESEIRRALDGVAGIRGLQFNLGDRELAIAADDSALSQALEAIRKAGFKPEPLGVALRPCST